MPALRADAGQKETDVIDLEQLRAPFPPEKVSWRIGSKGGDMGMALAYIDARDVMERLDAVCGPQNWQCAYPHALAKTVCSIGIQFSGAPGSGGGSWWVWKANGAGDTDVEAEKGALSDAFKRAAVCWGIGRYLYDLPSPWVAIEPAGRSFKIADREMPRLRKLLSGMPLSPIPANPDRTPIQRTIDKWIGDMNAMPTAKDLNEWEGERHEKITKLKTVNPAEHARFVAELMHRYSVLNGTMDEETI